MARLTCMALAVLVVGGCSGAGNQRFGSSIAPPVLELAAALDIAMRADAAAAAAMGGADPARLSAVFKARALQALSDQVARLRERSIRLEERAPVRRLDIWDAGRRNVVIQVESQVRLVSLDQPDPTWSNSVRRWWAQLSYIAGAWWVIDQRNLGPDQGGAL